MSCKPSPRSQRTPTPILTAAEEAEEASWLPHRATPVLNQLREPKPVSETGFVYLGIAPPFADPGWARALGLRLRGA